MPDEGDVDRAPPRDTEARDRDADVPEVAARGSAASDEYLGLHPAGDPFVTALYEDVLGRFPDADGLAAHVGDLGFNFCGRARAFLDSDEHHERFVESTYQDLLGRLPERSALQLGVRLADGMTLEGFVQLVAAGDEYYAGR